MNETFSLHPDAAARIRMLIDLQDERPLITSEGEKQTVRNETDRDV